MHRQILNNLDILLPKTPYDIYKYDKKSEAVKDKRSNALSNIFVNSFVNIAS